MSCCPTDRTAEVSEYKPKHLPVYEAGDYKSHTAVIYIPDIFGLSPQAKEVCDIIGERTGYRVVAMDFFNGSPYKLEWFGAAPPGKELMPWIKSFDYATFIKPAVEAQIAKMKSQGQTTFYAIGNCWGARMALNLTHDDIITRIVCFHPSFLSDTTDVVIKAPQCHLLSKDEAEHAAIQEAIKKSEFAAQSVWEVFPTMHHGWMAARRDEKDPENMKEFDRGIEIAVKFLTQKE